MVSNFFITPIRVRVKVKVRVSVRVRVRVRLIGIIGLETCGGVVMRHDVFRHDRDIAPRRHVAFQIRK